MTEEAKYRIRKMALYVSFGVKDFTELVLISNLKTGRSVIVKREGEFDDLKLQGCGTLSVSAFDNDKEAHRALELRVNECHALGRAPYEGRFGIQGIPKSSISSDGAFVREEKYELKESMIMDYYGKEWGALIMLELNPQVDVAVSQKQDQVAACGEHWGTW